MKYFRASALLLSVFLLSAISGCASLQSGSAAPKLAVTYGTLKFIDAAPVTARCDRGERVRAIAADAKSFFDTQTFSLEQINHAVRAKVPWHELDIADQVLADALITIVVEEIGAQTVNGFIDPETAYNASRILGWVEQATLLASCST